MVENERQRTNATIVDERRRELFHEEIIIALNLEECRWRILPLNGRCGAEVTDSHPSVARSMRYVVAVMQRLGRRRQPIQPFFKPRPSTPPAAPCPEYSGAGYVQDWEGNWQPCGRCGS